MDTTTIHIEKGAHPMREDSFVSARRASRLFRFSYDAVRRMARGSKTNGVTAFHRGRRLYIRVGDVLDCAAYMKASGRKRLPRGWRIDGVRGWVRYSPEGMKRRRALGDGISNRRAMYRLVPETPVK